MADKPSDTQTFAQFLEEQPAPAETVTLAGYVARSTRPGMFSLTTGGQTLELSTDAVKSHKVLSEGPQKLVELEVIASKVDSKVVKTVAADVGVKNPIFDHFTRKEVITDFISDKHVHKDPIIDPIFTEPGGVDPGPLAANAAAGAQPFVLATPHHAPASTIAAQMGTTAAAQIASTPQTDVTTVAWFDRVHTFKELVKDPIYDSITLPESIIPDPTNTLAEGIGIQGGPGQVINPAMQAQAFMAQGPTATAAQVNPAALSAATIVYYDRPYTLAWLDSPHTIKELVKDPITDPITIVEGLPGGGGGTLQEGVGGGGIVTNPVWNLPGMMF